MSSEGSHATPFSDLVLARVRELVDHRSPWHRVLWQIGTITGLEEVVEYAESVAQGLSSTGLDYVCKSMHREVQDDVGLGDKTNRDRIAKSLNANTLKSQSGREQLRHLALSSRAGYLLRWGIAIAGGEQHPGVEQTSRFLASHLLDTGFSGDMLHGWVQRIADSAESPDLALWLESADKASSLPPTAHRVLIPLTSAPPAQPSGPFEYLDQAETLRWLREAGEIPDRSPAGALCIELAARDPWSAVRRAAERVTRARARVAAGVRTAGALETWGHAVVAGRPGTIALADPRRRLLVPTLDRNDLLYAVGSEERARAFDDALELASQVAQGPAGAAITGAWAAVEALLREPAGEGSAAAADRMGSIVACSWPRAELTSLVQRHRKHGDDALAETLRGAWTVQQQLPLMEGSIREGRAPKFADPRDIAAVDRVQALGADPDTIRRVRRFASEAFRRLYNQRNLVMHAGYLRSVALRPTLRTLPPLLSAGLDRVANALFATETPSAIALAAQAEEEIHRQGTSMGRPLWALLEPRS